MADFNFEDYLKKQRSSSAQQTTRSQGGNFDFGTYLQQQNKSSQTQQGGGFDFAAYLREQNQPKPGTPEYASMQRRNAAIADATYGRQARKISSRLNEEIERVNSLIDSYNGSTSSWRSDEDYKALLDQINAQSADLKSWRQEVAGAKSALSPESYQEILDRIDEIGGMYRSVMDSSAARQAEQRRYTRLYGDDAQNRYAADIQNAQFADRYGRMNATQIQNAIDNLQSGYFKDDDEVAARYSELNRAVDTAEMNWRDGGGAKEKAAYEAAVKERDAFAASIPSLKIGQENPAQAEVDWLEQYKPYANYNAGAAKYGVDLYEMKPYEVVDWADDPSRTEQERNWARNYMTETMQAGGQYGMDEYRRVAEAQRAFDNIGDETAKQYIRDVAKYKNEISTYGSATYDQYAQAAMDALGISASELDALVDATSEYLNSEEANRISESTREYATRNFGGRAASWFAAAAVNPAANLESSAYMILESIAGQGQQSSSAAGMRGYRFVQDVRGAQGEQIAQRFTKEIAGQNVAQWLYQAVNSTVDSAVNMAITSATLGMFGLAPTGAQGLDVLKTGEFWARNAVSNAIMGSGAATQAFIDAKQQGATASSALVKGITAGLVEGLTEAIGGEAIVNRMVRGEGALMNAIRSFMSEGVEEYASNELNRFLGNAIFREDNITIYRNIAALFGAYKKAGYSDIDAWKTAAKEALNEDVSAFLAGGLSGLLMGAGSSMIQNTATGRQAIRAYGSRSNAISNVNESVRQANALNGLYDEQIKPLGNRASAYAIGRTIQAAQQSRSYADTRDAMSEIAPIVRDYIKNTVVGITDADLDVYTSAAVKMFMEEQFKGLPVSDEIDELLDMTKSEKAAARSGMVKAAFRSLMSNQFNELYLGASNVYSRSAPDTKAAGLQEGQNAGEYARDKAAVIGIARAIGDRTVATELALANKGSLTEEQVRAIVRNHTEETGVGSISEDGKLVLADSVPNAERAALRSAFAKIDAADTDAREDFSIAASSVYNLALNYDGTRFAEDALSQKLSQYPSIREQLQAVYDAGAKERADSGRIAAEEPGARKVSDAAYAEEKRTGLVSEETVNYYNRVSGLNINAVNTRDIDQRQRQMINFAKRLSKMLHVDIVFFDSRNEAGRRTSNANGFYANGTVYLDINAGLENGGSVTFTLAHELTHAMRASARSQFNALQNFVVNYYYDGNPDKFDDAIGELMDEDRSLNETGAAEELVARSCENMLRDSTAIRTLYEQNPTLHGTIGKAIAKFVDTFNKVVRQLEGNNRAIEGLSAQFQESADALREMQRLWDAGIVAMAQNRAASFKGDSRVDAKTDAALAESGLVATDGVVVGVDLAERMEKEGFEKPPEPLEKTSLKTMKAWAANYAAIGGGQDVTQILETFADQMMADDAILGYVPDGYYKYNKMGPLRKNVEYRWTYDMDASCPRTFQFVNYRDRLQAIAGRPLTANESLNLMYLMKRMGQQIPCTYCYVENKRVMKSASYLNWFASRQAVINAGTDEDALKSMYGYNEKTGAVGKAAQDVFNGWREEAKKGGAYNPSAEEAWTEWHVAQNSVFNFLDAQLADKAIKFAPNAKGNATTAGLTRLVAAQFGVRGKEALNELRSMVGQWQYDTLAGNEHNYGIPNDNTVSRVNSDALKLHRLASNYASSVSQARLVDDYMPYTDQLKNVSKADKAYIMGMGGIRKHSSNDFRIDYVLDYLQFYADLAAGGWTGHTYTKSIDFCKIFGNTGDRINLSIAMETRNGKIVENLQEGASWREARQLRRAYRDLGTMAMVTDNAQLSFALNSDWIDMVIPFHASGLPKEVWYNLRAWFDYTTRQLESYYTLTEMKQKLSDAKVDYAGLDSAEIEALFNSTFGIKVITAANGNRVKPHFFPNDTVVNGQTVPGHHNDARRYFELCEQYGVHPRFYGVKVTDRNGNIIDVTEHENYLKLIKETSRTDTEQRPIEFSFDKEDKNLGMTPLEYAMQRMQEEAKNGGYANTAEDPYGIVNMFQELYLGKDRDIGWMPARDSGEEGGIEDRFYAALDATQAAYGEIYDADTQTLDATGYQRALIESNSDVFENENAASDDMAEETGIKFSKKLDQDTLDFLDNQDHVTVYRAMQVIDGKLYPPMAAQIRDENGKLQYVEPTEIGEWYQAVERPDLLDKNGKFVLNKGNGTNVPAAYNPYFHSSASPLNDQFSSAWKRPNLVVVEGEIPASELTSGYRAQGAKNAVGETKWHSGPVASKLKGDKARRVFLSRWFRVNRIMTDAEVADIVADTLRGEDVRVPSNVVTPGLLAELRARNVPIEEKTPQNSGIKLSPKSLLDDARRDIHDLDDDTVLDLLQYADFGAYDDGTYIPIRKNTPVELISSTRGLPYGEVKDLPFIVPVKKARQSMTPEGETYKGEKGHGQTPYSLQEIFQNMDHPRHLVWEEEYHRYAVVVSYRNRNGYSAVVPFDLNQNKNQVEMNQYPGGAYNVAVTIHDRTNLEKYLKDPNHIEIPINKEDVPQRSSGRSGPSLLNGTSSTDTLSQPGEDVKTSLKNVTDRQLLSEALLEHYNEGPESEALQTYQHRIREMEAKQDRLEEVNAQARAMIDRTDPEGVQERHLLQREAQRLRKEIREYDAQIYKLEKGLALKSVIAIEREAAARAAANLANGRADERYRAAEQRWEERLNDQKARSAAKMDAIVQKWTERLEAQKEAGRNRLREYRIRRDQSEAVKKYRGRVEDSVKDLMRLVTENSDVRHVPDQLREPLAEFLESINTESKGLITSREKVINALGDNRGDLTTIQESARDRDWARRFERLHTALLQQRTDEEAGKVGTQLYLPDDFYDLLNEAAKAIRTFTDRYGNLGSIYDMDAQSLREISQVLRILKHTVNSANQTMVNKYAAHISDIARRTMDELRDLGAAGTKRGIAGWLDNLVFWNNGTPYYVFKRFGDAGFSTFQAFMDGQGKLAKIAEKITNDSREMFTSDEVKEWQNEVHEVKLSNGKTVRMTAAQLMSFYCLSKRSQAVGHLLGGGMKIGAFRDGRQTVDDRTDHVLGVKDIENINSLLSDRQRQVADNIQRYMSTYGSELGNEISMRRFGYKAYGETNYFPIESDRQNLSGTSEEEQRASMLRLLNMSHTKSLVDNANNAIVINNIFDVFANHMSDMAEYNALSLPLLDMVRWFNYQDRTENSEGKVLTDTVQKSLATAFGGYDKGNNNVKLLANDYVKTFLKDINGNNERGRDIGIGNLMGRYKRASVAANLRVAIQQPMSIMRAGAVIDYKWLAKGIAEAAAHPVETSRELSEYSNEAKWKDQGHHDIYIGRSLAQQIKNDQSFIDRAVDKSMVLAEIGDKVTWSALWAACRAEQASKGLSGDALMEATAKRFQEVVYSTQVMDATTTRSQSMRSNNPLNQMWTAFMAEPTLSVNLLADSYMQYRLAARRGGDTAQARQQALRATAKIGVRATAAYVFNALAVTLAESLIDAFRDDDDYETFIDKYVDAFGGNVADELNPLSKITVIKDILNIFTSKYGAGDRMDVAALSQAKKTIDILAELYKVNVLGEAPTEKTYYGKMPTYGVIYQALKTISQATGVPLAGLTRDVIAMYNTFLAANIPALPRVKTYNENPKVEGYPALYDAIADGDTRAEIKLREEMFYNGLTDDDIADGLKNEIKSHYVAGDIDRWEASTMLVECCGYSTTDTGNKGVYYQLKRWEYDGDGTFSMYGDLNKALEAENTTQTKNAVDELLKQYGAEPSNIKSQITSTLKPIYVEASDAERKRIYDLMLSTGLYDAEELTKQLARWVSDAEKEKTKA